MNVDLSKWAKKSQSIQEHTNQVKQVATLILKRHSVVLYKLSRRVTCSFFLQSLPNQKEFEEFILELIQFHDYGKVNPDFQEYIQGSYKTSDERKHAIYSFLLWLLHNLQLPIKMPIQTFNFRAWIAYGVIAGHHNHLNEIPDSREYRDDLMKYCLHLVEWGVIDKAEERVLTKQILTLFKTRPNGDNSTALTIVKYIYSVLNVSDSIASSDIPINEYDTAVTHLLFKDINNTNIHQKINQSSIIRKVKDSTIVLNASFGEMNDINDIRVLLNKRTMGAFRSSADIYILEAPVGTGKTLSSISLAEALIEKQDKRKLISVFPLNSVQSQYQSVLQNDLKIDEEYMNVINSESLFRLDKGNQGENSLSIANSNLWLFERTCFSNELIVTSHVRFFETFMALTRSSSLGFLSIINSVIIIDEFQNYPYTYWEGVWEDLLRISELLGVKWIFTTGTFPVSKKQLKELYGERITYVLSEEETEALFTHPILKNRTYISELNPTVTYSDNEEGILQLGQHIIEDILNQEGTDNRQFIVCVNYVKHAKWLYDSLSVQSELNQLGFSFYFLCGRQSPSYKKELIRNISELNKSENRDKRCILITTKTVECGMDFDFDKGYKEIDTGHSIEQFSGRINRSGLRPTALIKMFRINRFKQETEKLYRMDKQTINDVRNKTFHSLFERIFSQNKFNIRRASYRYNLLHQHLEYSDYQKTMSIINTDEYTQDIFLVPDEEREVFKSILHSRKQPVSYSDKIAHSIRLKNDLESYRVTVTNRWLRQHLNTTLESYDYSGISYHIMNANYFNELLERFTINGISSYIEKD